MSPCKGYFQQSLLRCLYLWWGQGVTLELPRVKTPTWRLRFPRLTRVHVPSQTVASDSL